MIEEEERSAEARARAEQALAWLLAGLADSEIELVVLGGLVPTALTRGREVELPAHLGTTDVDLLLITHVTQRENLGPVEATLRRLGFAPDPGGWRWRGQLDRSRVKIEFLCDLPSVREGEMVRPIGCAELHACNLRGTGYVARDWEWQEIVALSPAGEPLAVQARFAGLQGYLLSKCVAARTRGAEKDFYDLVYVLIHNRAGGPRQAAELLAAGEFATDVRSLEPTFRELAARYASSTDFAARCYASQMLLVDPSLEDAILRADATVAVAEFVETLIGVAAAAIGGR